jgi:hypothetical protein
VGIGVGDAWNRVDSGQDQLGQCVLMGNLNNRENIRFSPARIDLLDFSDICEGFDDFSRLTWMDIDEDVSPVGHVTILYMKDHPMVPGGTGATVTNHYNEVNVSWKSR